MSVLTRICAPGRQGFCLFLFTVESLVSRTLLTYRKYSHVRWMKEFHAFLLWFFYLEFLLAHIGYPKWCWLFFQLYLSAPDVIFTGCIRIKTQVLIHKALFKSVWSIPQSTCVFIFFCSIYLNLNSKEYISNTMLRSTPIFPFLGTLAFPHFKCGRCITKWCSLSVPYRIQTD